MSGYMSFDMRSVIGDKLSLECNYKSLRSLIIEFFHRRGEELTASGKKRLRKLLMELVENNDIVECSVSNIELGYIAYKAFYGLR